MQSFRYTNIPLIPWQTVYSNNVAGRGVLREGSIHPKPHHDVIDLLLQQASCIVLKELAETVAVAAATVAAAVAVAPWLYLAGLIGSLRYLQAVQESASRCLQLLPLLLLLLMLFSQHALCHKLWQQLLQFSFFFSFRN